MMLTPLSTEDSVLWDLRICRWESGIESAGMDDGKVRGYDRVSSLCLGG